jgi:RNAse (barnase) inhibitor barstar
LTLLRKEKRNNVAKKIARQIVDIVDRAAEDLEFRVRASA